MPGSVGLGRKLVLPITTLKLFIKLLMTKIMTLYLLFEQLEAGRLKLDTQLRVSAFAAQQPPTKLGLNANQKLAVEDAIKGRVTKSANDAAVVVAEAIAGS